MSQYNFGSGYLFLRDSSNNARAVAVLKDVSVEIDQELKELYGSQKFPVAVAYGQSKVSGKAKFGAWDGKLLASVLNVAASAGRKLYVVNSGTAAAATVTASPTGTGFVTDLGVLDSGLQPMTLTSSAPAVGSYSVSVSGVYAFSGSQTGSVYLSYAYSTGSGFTVALNNSDMGSTTTFELHLTEGYGGKYTGAKLFSVVVPKLSLGFKQTDFAEYDVDFDANANTAGSVGEFYGE